MQKRYTNLAPLTADNFEQNIHQFVEIELVSPRDSRHSWLEHTAWADAQSLSGREHFAEVRYEDLRTNPEIHLAEVLAQIGHDRSLTEVNSAVASNSFDSLSGGRSPGQVDDSSFFRSGIQGEWKRKMSSETAEMIQAVFEPQMMRLGYLVEDSS